MSYVISDPYDTSHDHHPRTISDCDDHIPHHSYTVQKTQHILANSHSDQHQRLTDGLLSSDEHHDTDNDSQERAIRTTNKENAITSATRNENNSDNNENTEQVINLRHLEEIQLQAISTWQRRTLLVFIAHFLIGLLILKSDYWFTTVIGLGFLFACFVYAYTAKQKRIHFLFIYLFVVLVNFAKNTIIIAFYVAPDNTDRAPFDVFLLITLFVDDILLTPSSLYCIFFLYRSISITNLTF